jgi:hypothetical protein
MVGDAIGVTLDVATFIVSLGTKSFCYILDLVVD